MRKIMTTLVLGKGVDSSFYINFCGKQLKMKVFMVP